MVFPVVGGDGKSTGYEIENSIRFQPNEYVSRYNGVGDESSNAGKIGTVSLWTKRGDLGRAQGLFVVYEHNGQGYQTIWFNSDDTLQLAYEISGTEYQVKTDAKFRDHSAWYHVVAMTDTTQGTDSNRMKIYVNGTEQSYGSTAYPPQNTTLLWGKGDSTNYQYRIGNKRGVGSTSYANYNGYIAEVHLCMGQNYTASEFGETNDNGVWIPKEADVSYGTNGGFYEFKQTGTSANASGIGADTSGTGNHAGVGGGIDATNITVDTPTNNFATLNPLANSSYTDLSEGNLKSTGNTASNNGNTESTIAVANGKWYWEHKMTTSASPYYPTTGIVKPETVGRLINGGTNGMVGVVTDSVSYEFDGDRRISNTSTDDHFASLSNGDIVGIALDMDNGAVYFSKNGTYQNSSDPTSGSNKTNAAHTWTADGRLYMAATASYNSSVAEINFGNAPFSISSGNADANGYGNFEYAVPSGYYALCTKNLAEYG
jgi:hypothetical protein